MVLIREVWAVSTIHKAPKEDVDWLVKDDVPEDMPRPRGWEGSQGNGFLYEWYSIFSDLFAAHRGNGKMNGAMNPAAQYLMHEKVRQLISAASSRTNSNAE